LFINPSPEKHVFFRQPPKNPAANLKIRNEKSRFKHIFPALPEVYFEPLVNLAKKFEVWGFKGCPLVALLTTCHLPRSHAFFLKQFGSIIYRGCGAELRQSLLYGANTQGLMGLL
jgi:hypothetical protein